MMPKDATRRGGLELIAGGASAQAEVIDVQLQLDDAQALALAQLVKRIGWADLRGNAASDSEAYAMRSAISALQRSLAEAGYAPR